MPHLFLCGLPSKLGVAGRIVAGAAMVKTSPKGVVCWGWHESIIGDEEPVRTNKPSNGLVGRCGILIPYHTMHRVAVRYYLGSSRPRMRHFEEA
jgi:hypothetical protein